MLLSIVIPVYNAKPYLATLIDGFRNQRHTDFELVLVDDGSTDGSYEELCRLTADLPFSVTLHRQDNAGVSAARNVGTTLAKGEYLSFVDSDDVVHPDYVNTLHETVCQHSACDVLLFRSRQIEEGDPCTAQTFSSSIERQTSTTVLTRFIHNPTALSMCNVCIRREFHLKQALCFREGYKYYEDYELLCRTLALAQSVLVAERDLYFYIQRPQSAMARFTVDRLSCLSLMRDLYPLLQQQTPVFFSLFDRWMIARLLWSVMWQASTAFSFTDALRFARLANVKDRMRRLYDYPCRKVRYSARLFVASVPAFVLAVRLVKKGHTRIQKTEFTPFKVFFEHRENGGEQW